MRGHNICFIAELTKQISLITTKYSFLSRALKVYAANVDVSGENIFQFQISVHLVHHPLIPFAGVNILLSANKYIRFTIPHYSFKF